ncbi:hypothetical protein KIPB_000945 [Kipferlia bialata]|uniref:Uncharacterized protein n=1 Tax=Kipferlia bialata TaxID=797122 RepID=A0A9K3GFF7_9EUKA|nr:hypothetical protein KIPB_000945 [Kipferlia bialata]|eukprot:g945.t1
MRCPSVRNVFLYPPVTSARIADLVAFPEDRFFLQSHQRNGKTTLLKELAYRLCHGGVEGVTGVAIYIEFEGTSKAEGRKLVDSIVRGGGSLWHKDLVQFLKTVSSLATFYGIPLSARTGRGSREATAGDYEALLNSVGVIWEYSPVMCDNDPSTGLPPLYMLVDEAGKLVEKGEKTIKKRYEGVLSTILPQSRQLGTFGGDNTRVIGCGCTDLATLVQGVQGHTSGRSNYIHYVPPLEEAERGAGGAYGLFCHICHLAGKSPDDLLADYLGLRLPEENEVTRDEAEGERNASEGEGDHAGPDAESDEREGEGDRGEAMSDVSGSDYIDPGIYTIEKGRRCVYEVTAGVSGLVLSFAEGVINGDNTMERSLRTMVKNFVKRCTTETRSSKAYELILKHLAGISNDEVVRGDFANAGMLPGVDEQYRIPSPLVRALVGYLAESIDQAQESAAIDHIRVVMWEAERENNVALVGWLAEILARRFLGGKRAPTLTQGPVVVSTVVPPVEPRPKRKALS